MYHTLFSAKQWKSSVYKKRNCCYKKTNYKKDRSAECFLMSWTVISADVFNWTFLFMPTFLLPK